jgi:hypothetical protein
VHTALDREGSATPPVPLPLAHPTGIAPCGGELLVTGARPGEGTPLVLRLDRSGAVLALSALPVGNRLLRRPAPLCPDGRPLVLWERFEGHGSRIWAFHPDRPGEDPRPLPATGFTSHLAVSEVQAGLLLARVSGPSADLRLTWLDADLNELAASVVVSGVGAVAAAGAAGSAAVAWVQGSGRRLRLQWFGSDRAPAADPADLLEVHGPSSLQSLRMLGGVDRLALLYRVVTVGDPEAEDRLPPCSASEWLATVEPGGRTPSTPRPVEPPGAGGGTGGWLGPRLLVAHGSLEPVLSIFEP